MLSSQPPASFVGMRLPMAAVNIAGSFHQHIQHEPLVMFFGPSDRAPHPWDFPKVGDDSKLDHSAVVLSPSRSPASACGACCKGQD